MMNFTPVQLAFLRALYFAGNTLAYQKMLIRLIQEDERIHGPQPSLLQAIEQAAIAKALGWTA